MTRGESINAGLTLVAAIAAIASAVFAYQAHSYTTNLHRPHLSLSVELFESRSDNGIRLHNGGMTPARIHSYELSDGASSTAVEWAARDLESLGWVHGQVVHHPLTGDISVPGGQSRPIVSIDRSIGLTDIAILDRLFSELQIEICYCDMTSSDCWLHKWNYSQRHHPARGEDALAGCAI